LVEISPTDLTAVFDISFANADIERLNLEDRLDALRAGCSGFTSNLKLNGTMTNPSGKEALVGKSTVSAPEDMVDSGCQKWGCGSQDPEIL
jgi:hypothetical protein